MLLFTATMRSGWCSSPTRAGNTKSRWTGWQPDEVTRLRQDADPYATAKEALRHSQQQAMRLVHDRTGDGQGRL